jgi:ATP-dependent RNA helicase DeaD
MTDDNLAAAVPAEAADAPPLARRLTFDDLPLEPELRQAVAEMGYLSPTDVQAAVFDPVLAGKDIMVESRTGTGKTAAFGIPIVQKLDPGVTGAQVLCLAPTRELALQVADEMKRITRYKSLSVVAVYGGAAMGPQVEALTGGAQIVVGTPGRVLDHIRRRTFKTGTIRHLVLDECDEMLSMGFQEEIDAILATLPPRDERQTLLFSATIPEAIERIGRRQMREPEKISLIQGDVSVAEIEHLYYMISGMARTRDLLKILKTEKPESAIIFCNTREDTNTVARYLMRNGYDAEAISSDLTQKDRERVMKRSRDKNLQFLVATDIAARGIDISDLSHVINYTFPDSPEIYVHRTGRTGRAGKSGVAISMIGPRDIGSFYMLKLTYKIRPVERELPTAEELQTMIEVEKIEKVVKLVDETPPAEYLSLARRLWQSTDGERVVGVLLERLLAAPEQQPARAQAPAVRARRSERDEWERPMRSERSERSERPLRSGRPERAEREQLGRGEPGGAEQPEAPRSPQSEEGFGDSGEVTAVERPILMASLEPVESGEGDEVTDVRGDRPAEAAGERDPARRRRRRRPRHDSDAMTMSRGLDGTEAAAPAGEAGGEAAAAANGEVRCERSGEGRGERRSARPERERDRGGRGGGRGGERGGRGGERNGTARSAPSLLPRPERKPIQAAGDGREFWEAWADEKTSGTTTPTDTPAAPRGDEPAAAAAAAAPRRVEERGGRDDEDVGEDGDLSARLYVNIGKRESATAEDIRALIGGELGDDAGRIGSVALRNTHAYVRVPEDLVDRVIESVRGKQYSGRDVMVERARR